MKRQLTNIIRFLMDECLPPVIRDNRYFMYPFYFLAYKGENINQIMDLKSLIHDFSPEEYADFYRNLNSISRNRDTDLNKACIDYIINRLDGTVSSLLDAGCGSGYLLKQIKYHHPSIALTGCDLLEQSDQLPYSYIQSEILNLDLSIGPFDVITCCHTLEHVINLKETVQKLRSLCNKYLIIVVPCQRYYYYTLDEHIHFFTNEFHLRTLMGIRNKTIMYCKNIGGDWLLVIKGSHV